MHCKNVYGQATDSVPKAPVLLTRSRKQFAPLLARRIRPLNCVVIATSISVICDVIRTIRLTLNELLDSGGSHD